MNLNNIINNKLCQGRLKTNIFRQCNNKICDNLLCKKHLELFTKECNLVQINEPLFKPNYINDLLKNYEKLLDKKFYNSKENFILIKYLLLLLVNNNNNYDIKNIISITKKTYIIPLYVSVVKQFISYSKNNQFFLHCL